MYTPIGDDGLLSIGTVGRRFDETDVQFAEILAENVAAAIRVVEDDGHGIPENERDSVLDHGYTTGTGTGVGLCIVGDIVDAHGWEVTVTESRDGGARFEISTRG
jgi:signal transduction histidine kinase